MFGKKKDKEKKIRRSYDFNDFPHLAVVKPRERYVFHSDYYEIDDGSYATILGFYHSEGNDDAFPTFWGVNRIPRNIIDNDVVIICFEQIARMSEGWVRDHKGTAEKIIGMNANEQEDAGKSISEKRKASRRAKEFAEVIKELDNSASYLQCVYKMMVKAPSLEKLDDAVKSITTWYTERFGNGLIASAMMGCQRQELTGLFLKNDKKTGKPFYFTSTEFAGSYSLVTHGIEDPYGEYVGYMKGDVNNAAVLFEIDRYKQHIVVGSEWKKDRADTKIPVADFWGSKISQTALMHNHRVVHIVLDNTNLDLLGPKFERITYKIDMNNGDVNMFEMFGEKQDELSIFARQEQKLRLMMELVSKSPADYQAAIKGVFHDVLTKFYVDKHMWNLDPSKNRDRLRLVGIPHYEVPKLSAFVSYLRGERQKYLKDGDVERLHAATEVLSTFNELNESHGDLFDKITADEIDGVRNGRRVIYDFARLHLRGHAIAMAQLINIIGYAVGNLGSGDVVIFHGSDKIDDSVKEYISEQLDDLYSKGGRAVFLYNKIDKMLDDSAFSGINNADYTVLGTMSPQQMAKYEELIGQKIPDDLKVQVAEKSQDMIYIRRDFTNVVFDMDLSLGMQKKRGIRV